MRFRLTLLTGCSSSREARQRRAEFPGKALFIAKEYVHAYVTGGALLPLEP